MQLWASAPPVFAVGPNINYLHAGGIKCLPQLVICRTSFGHGLCIHKFDRADANTLLGASF